jgi:hypothetical protein
MYHVGHWDTGREGRPPELVGYMAKERWIYSRFMLDPMESSINRLEMFWFHEQAGLLRHVVHIKCTLAPLCLVCMFRPSLAQNPPKLDSLNTTCYLQ